MARNKKNKLTAIVGCAGIGVGSWGIKNAGFCTLAAIERDPRFAERYSINYPNVKVLNEDIREVNNSKLMRELRLKKGDLDLLQVSPSCKNFSVANWEGRETQEDIEVVRAIALQSLYLAPKAILIEQVVPYLKSESWQSLREYLEFRYDVKTYKLNASDFGTPQSRKRFFAIAIRKDIGVAPDEIPCTGDKLSWFEAIHDLIDESRLIPARYGLAPWQIKRFEGMSEVDFATLMSSGNPSTTRFRSSGDVSFTIVSNIRQSLYHRVLLIERVGTRNSKLNIRSENEVAPTVRALGGDRHWHKFSVLLGSDLTVKELLDNAKVFQLTPRCLARLMGLPDEFLLSGINPIDAEGLGNGVAVQVIEAIAKTIKGIIYKNV